jgi:hypothetical protein
MLEPSWHDDIAVIASPPLGAVAALGEEPVHFVTVEVASEFGARACTKKKVLLTEGS